MTATKSIALFSEKIAKKKMKLQKQPGLQLSGPLWSSRGDGLALTGSPRDAGLCQAAALQGDGLTCKAVVTLLGLCSEVAASPTLQGRAVGQEKADLLLLLLALGRTC